MVSKKEEATNKLKSFIKQAQEELEKIEAKSEHAWDKVKDKEESVEHFIQKNPLLAIGGALVVGYAVGYLLKRRK